MHISANLLSCVACFQCGDLKKDMCGGLMGGEESKQGSRKSEEGAESPRMLHRVANGDNDAESQGLENKLF